VSKGDEAPLLTRRDLLAGLATTPALVAFVVAARTHAAYRKDSRHGIFGDLLERLPMPGGAGESGAAPAGPVLNVGLIGVGYRGKQLLVAAGFAQPGQLAAGESLGTDGEAPLGIRIAGVCDIYQPNLDWGVVASGGTAVPYRKARDLIASPGIDAVILAVPDHWHVPLAVEAARAGKHVYVEKCFSHDVDGALAAAEAVKAAGVVLQLGHQGRQNSLYALAARLAGDGLLGGIRLAQAFTNHNGPVLAWNGAIPKEAGPRNVDWEAFEGNGATHPFDLDRFFHWRKYWAYGTGLSGDAFTHEWDALDLVLGGLGIPGTAIASGGIYGWRDGRETPDTYQVVYEYPERGLALTYNATQANGWRRDKILFGADATMTLEGGVRVYADRDSTRYAEFLKTGRIDPDRPIAAYLPGDGRWLDAGTSATQHWAVSRGLLYSTTPTGRRVNTATLHLRDWLDAIRSRRQPACPIDLAVVEAVTAHMGTLSMRWGCRVRWDAAARKVVPDRDTGGTA
jgi:predicted dehydrogenase